LLENNLDFRRVQSKLINDAVHDPKSIVMMPLEKWQTLVEKSERSGRIAEMRSALREAYAKGYDDYNAHLYAAAKSRELIDFARAGLITRHLNRYIPFTNAKVQGLSRTMTVLRNQPGKFLARWSGYVLTPTIANYAWNYMQGPDVLEEYRQLPAYIRQTFWNFKVGDVWLRIPKPFELGVLATGVEYAIDQQLGNPSAGDGYFNDLAKSMMPVDETAILGGGYKALVENWVNYDAFKGKHLIPPFEEGMRLDKREGAKRASRLGQLIGYSINVDPRKVDHLIDSLSGDFGDAAMTLSDIGREDKVIPLSKPLNYATGLFTDTPAYSAVDVQYVLDHARGVGVRGILKDEIDEFFAAKTAKERAAKAKALRTAATALRREIEAETKGKSGKAYSDAVESALAGYGTGGDGD